MTEYHEKLAEIGGTILTVIGMVLLIIAIILLLIDNNHKTLAAVVLIVAIESLMVGIMGLAIYFLKIRRKSPNFEF